MRLALFLWVASAALLCYVYVGYPVLLTLAARWWGRAPAREPAEVPLPSVTVVFCAHNEADVLPTKIANCRALEYPADRLDFWVGSDGSTDGTNALVQAWAQEGRVTLLLNPRREGKTALLNRVVPFVSGTIVLFTDASTLVAPDAVQRHVAHYRDPQVGCVGGDLVFVNTAASPVSGAHGLYWRYERHLRQCESCLGLLATVSGANYSLRRDLWRAVPQHYADDCLSPLNVLAQGARIVSDPQATAYEVAAESRRGLLRRRVRMVTRDLAGTLTRPALLNPLRFPGVTWSLWSHKLLRWCGAPALVVLLVSNLFLLAWPVFRGTLVLQVAWYAVSLLGALRPGHRVGRWLALPTYFNLSQLAILLGLVQLLRGQHAATWQREGRRATHDVA